MGMFDDLTTPQKSGGMFDDLIGVQPPVEPLSRMDKFLKGIRDPIDGGAQFLSNMLPKGITDAGNSANNWLADKTGLVGRLPEGGVAEQVKQQEIAYEARRKASGETGFDGYRMLGNVASPANLAIGSRIPAMASIGGRVAVGAASGAGMAALKPVSGDDYWKEKAIQAGEGALLGGIMPVVTGGIARVISPNASNNAQLQLLKNEGVRPTVGQTLGGAWNASEEKLQSLPIMGDMINRARQSTTSDFQVAAHNRALNPIGRELPSDVSGREAVNFTELALKDSYTSVLNKIGAIRPDQTFNSNVNNLRSMVGNMQMPPDEKLKFTSAVNDIASSIDRNGVITSDIYKTLESSLGSDAKKLYGSQNIWDGKIAPAVKQLQVELKDMLKRQAGTNADELQNVNTGWANFKRVQNASSKLGAENGEFTPAQFQNAVRALDKSKDKGSFARGDALMQDLGDAGAALLKNKVANSGTVERLMLGGGALGSYYMSSAIPTAMLGGLLGGAAMYTSPMQSILRSAVSSRPDFAEPAANAFRQAAPVFLPGGVQLGLNLLDY